MKEFLFYGNYFYGFCAVALSLEALLQQGTLGVGTKFYLAIFLLTVLYYTYPYVRKCSYISNNPRTNWYSKNFRLVSITQWLISLILSVIFLDFMLVNYSGLHSLGTEGWFLALAFPLGAALYYGIQSPAWRFNLRKNGVIKPFVIGFTWSRLVTIYPVIYSDIRHGHSYHLTQQALLLFLKNLMFIAILCILFDVKDFASDYLSRLRTFVVRMGLRKTIRRIVVPLTLAGLLSFMGYAFLHRFSTGKILLNLVPFMCLFVVAGSLRKRRRLLYYLVVIDGLMFLKAVCGILAISCF